MGVVGCGCGFVECVIMTDSEDIFVEHQYNASAKLWPLGP